MKYLSIQNLMLSFFLIFLTGCSVKENDSYFIKSVDLKFEEIGQSVIITQDNEVVITGFTNSIMNSDDVLLFKMSSSGQVIWMKTIGGMDSDMGYGLCESPDGNYCVTGNTRVNFRSAFTVLLNPIGQIIWANYFESEVGLAGYNILPSSDKGFYIVGTEGLNDILLLKINQFGNEVWRRNIGKKSGIELCKSLYLRKNGNIVISGSTTSFSFDEEPFMVEFDPEGQELKTTVYHNFTSAVIINDMLVLENNHIFLIGKQNRSRDTWSGCLISLIDDGNYGFEYSISDTNISCYNSIDYTNDNHLLLSGYQISDSLQSQVLIIKQQIDGNEIWRRLYGDRLNDEGYKSVDMDNGDILTVGYSTNKKNYSKDVYIIKTNPYGLQPME